MTCLIGRSTFDPCPRKWTTPKMHDCQACLDDWSERAAIGEYSGKLPRAEAEAQATRYVREDVEKREGDGQGRLF